MATSGVTIHSDGSTSRIANGHNSSENYEAKGITVQRGAFNTTIASPDRVEETDLVTVRGVQMTAQTARDQGLLEEAFTEAGVTLPDQATGADAPKQAEPTEARHKTGHEGYDQISSDLADRVEEGRMKGEEALEYDTAVANVALSNLTITEVVDVIDGMNSGDLTPGEVDRETLQVAQAVERKVTDAATKSAIAELGKAGFDRLSKLAEASSVVDQAIRQYAAMRALGRTTDTWADFLELAEEELSS